MQRAWKLQNGKRRFELTKSFNTASQARRHLHEASAYTWARITLQEIVEDAGFEPRSKAGSPNCVLRNCAVFHSAREVGPTLACSLKESVTARFMYIASQRALTTCSHTGINCKEDKLSDGNTDGDSSDRNIHLDLDSDRPISNHHFRCSKRVEKKSMNNLDAVAGLDDSTHHESTDEDVAGPISNNYESMETLHSAELDNNMGMDLKKQHCEVEIEKECENLSTGNDFYEDVKITDDAGEPLMPRSLLDLAVEDFMQKENDQGHLLWQEFKKAAARRHVFTCKSVIDSWLEEGNITSRPALIHTILAFRSWKKNKRALELFDWVMAEKPFELADMDYAIYMDLVGKIDGCRKASKYYTQIPKSFQTIMVYSALLAAYIEHNMERCARKLLSRARLMGLTEQVFLYNQMMLFYKGKGRISDVANLVKEMEEFGVDANLYTYNIILDLRARKGDVVGMRKVWKCIEREKNMKPDAASYALLAKGYINAGSFGKAELAIKHIEASPYRQKQVVYRWLLKLYAQLKREEDLERIWDSLTSVSKSLVDDYSIMIESLGKAGELKRAEELFREGVNKFGIKRLHQYHALLSVFLNNGMIDKAEDVVEKMSKDSINPGSATYHQLIEIYVRNGDEKKAMETLRKAQNASKIFSGHKPWYASYLTILEMFGEKGDVEHAESIIKDLKGAGYPCGFKTYNALLKAYVKANMTPYGFLDRMRADGAIPNSHIRNELHKLEVWRRVPSSLRVICSVRGPVSTTIKRAAFSVIHPMLALLALAAIITIITVFSVIWFT